MAKVLALFDDGTKAEEAVSALGAAGFGDDIHVVTHSGEAPGGAEPVPAEGGAAVVGQASGNGVAPTMGYVALTSLGLDSEAEGFFQSSLDDGAQLISVETGDAAEVESVLEKSGASRVDTV